eukprot:5107917-Prymnesium_polylepis.1
MHFRSLSPETRSLSLTTPPCPGRTRPSPRRTLSKALSPSAMVALRYDLRSKAVTRKQSWRLMDDTNTWSTWSAVLQPFRREAAWQPRHFWTRHADGRGAHVGDAQQTRRGHARS